MSEAPLQISGDGEIHAEPRRTGHRWLDMIVAGSAILISLISLLVAVEHGRTQERLVAANSWPFLTATTERSTSGAGQLASVSISNRGVGPAIIHSVRVVYSGRPVTGFRELLERCCGYRRPTGTREQIFERYADFGLATTAAVSQTVVPAGGTVTYLAMQRRPEHAAAWGRFNFMRTQLKFDACYCSVLGECWRSDLRDLDPTPVEKCPMPGPLDSTE